MSWRDRLRDASFRGVPFFVSSDESELGRRTVVHEAPGGTTVLVEDLGRRARRIRIDAYVLGADYDLARDALRVALEQPGPGTLVHPNLGTLRVSLADTARLSHSTREGGLARFTFTVVESLEQLEPKPRADTSSRVTSWAGTAERSTPASAYQGRLPAAPALVAAAPRAIDVTRASTTALTGLAATLARIVAGVKALRRVSASALSVSDGVQGEIAEFEDDLDALLLTPADLASRVIGLAALVLRPLVTVRALRLAFSGADVQATPNRARVASADEPTRPTGAQPVTPRLLTSTLLGILRSMVELGAGEPPAIDAVEAEIRAALVFTFRCGGVIAVAEAAAQVEFESADDAREVRAALLAAFDGLLLSALDDTMYGALADLQATTATHLAATAAALPSLTTITPARTLPALVLAHQIYGDATRDEELVARNRIRHPGFVPGGRALEVLSDA